MMNNIRHAKKVNEENATVGHLGQKYLVSGREISMRLWQEEPAAVDKAEVSRDYETVGYVIEGKAELWVNGKTIVLTPGDSWVVPTGALHRYRILDNFTAVEATHPPARDLA